MKSKKWLWWTLGILAALVLLAGAGFAGYRVGVVKGAQLADNPDAKAFMFEHMNRFEGKGWDHPNIQGQMPVFHQDFRQGHGFGGMRGGFFSPLFGLVRVAFWGFILWMVYKLISNSGWKLVREVPAAAPAVTPPAVVESADEDKAEA